MVDCGEVCKKTRDILKRGGKSPGFFAKRNEYRKDTALEYNTRDFWFEMRKDGTFKVDKCIGIRDNKTILQFQLLDDEGKDSVYNDGRPFEFFIEICDFTEEDELKFDKAYSKFF